MLSREQLLAAQQIQRAMFRRGHEPSARLVRYAGFRPLFERGHESVLRQLLRKTDIAHHPRETRDEFRRLNPPDRFDSAVYFKVCIGSTHATDHTTRPTAW